MGQEEGIGGQACWRVKQIWSRIRWREAWQKATVVQGCDPGPSGSDRDQKTPLKEGPVSVHRKMLYTFERKKNLLCVLERK